MSVLFDRAAAVLRLLPPETAHRVTVRSLRAGLAPRHPSPDSPLLSVQLWGRTFPNPIGLAAGFDKNAEVPDAMLRFGFGFVETGTVTPRPQAGNPRPRLFRLTEDAALINRLGFNNDGLPAAAVRLAARRGRPGIVGANIGKNRDTTDDIDDYVQGVEALAPLADYLVVNVSSPNTPGLRNLQRKEIVTRLIDALARARSKTVPENAPPLLLKIAPDLTPEEAGDLAEVALASALDGLIIANTTLSRPADLQSRQGHEAGGLSGRPLFALSTDLLAFMYRETAGKVPLIGVGGIASGRDAYDKIRAGASLVQLYTALVYQGPGLIVRLKRELLDCLARDGFPTVTAAIGSAAHTRPATRFGV